MPTIVKPKRTSKANNPMVKPTRATLHTRKACYKGHPMSGENVDRYEGSPKWIGCRKCRAQARIRYQIRQAEKIVAERKEAKAVAKAALDNAIPPKAVKPKAAIKAVKPKAVKPKAVKPGRVTGKVACGECKETFPDPPSASRHFRKAHGSKVA